MATDSTTVQDQVQMHNAWIGYSTLLPFNTIRGYTLFDSKAVAFISDEAGSFTQFYEFRTKGEFVLRDDGGMFLDKHTFKSHLTGTTYILVGESTIQATNGSITETITCQRMNITAHKRAKIAEGDTIIDGITFTDSNQDSDNNKRTFRLGAMFVNGVLQSEMMSKARYFWSEEKMYEKISLATSMTQTYPPPVEEMEEKNEVRKYDCFDCRHVSFNLKKMWQLSFLNKRDRSSLSSSKSTTRTTTMQRRFEIETNAGLNLTMYATFKNESDSDMIITKLVYDSIELPFPDRVDQDEKIIQLSDDLYVQVFVTPESDVEYIQAINKSELINSKRSLMSEITKIFEDDQGNILVFEYQYTVHEVFSTITKDGFILDYNEPKLDQTGLDVWLCKAISPSLITTVV